MVHRPLRLAVSEHDPSYPVVAPIHPDHVEILGDPAFTDSCREVRRLTLLDTPRLANLWSLCRMCDATGTIIEVGSFRGGGALHLSNSSPDRRIIVCDSFAGFAELDATLDRGFGKHMFTDNRREDVERLFEERGRDAIVLAGFFPASAAGVEIGQISFAHVDVDVYRATKETLDFLAPLMMPRSLMVLDDFHRGAEGVEQAVAEFVADHQDFVAFPLFPGQALLVKRTWFDR